MTNAPEEKLTVRIMALFETRRDLTIPAILAILPDEDPDAIKNAVNTLRGKSGVKRLRVKSYIKIAGRAGLEVPVLEVGSAPDVEKSVDNIEVNDDAIKRARWVREQREELKLKRELAALESWD
jgi:hypothetical protein